jgi:signal transduction histidine kinase
MMPFHPPKDQYFQRAAQWASCLLTLVLSLGWAWAGAEQEMRDLAVNSWPDAQGQSPPNSAFQVKIFQLGVASTLLVWSLVQWTLSYKRLYAIISMTLVFFLGRLLAQSEQLTNYLDLSSKHNHLLLMLFSVGYAMNALYLLHLLLADSDKQTQRKKVFYAAYAATIFVEAALLLMPSGNFIPAAVGLFVSVLTMIVWDFGESLKDKSVPVSVFRLRWIVLGVALSIFAFNLLCAFGLSGLVSKDQQIHRVFELLWLISAFLVIHLITLTDRHTFEQRCTEAKDAQKRAAHETQLRMNQQRFLSMLMHEIRTPLSVIKISTDMILHDMPVINDKKIWVNRIDVAIDNITQVIENCVQAEKHEEGLIKPQITRFLVEHELADMSGQYAADNAEQASRIEVAMDTSDRNWLETDKHFLRSMLLNLLSNAVKYSPPFTTVYLRIYKVQKQIPAMMHFEIENDIGKAGAPDQTQVFQRYYRAETAKKYAGTGLGLWLSQIMAQQLGARIDMELTSQQTIRFHFALPTTHHP